MNKYSTHIENLVTRVITTNEEFNLEKVLFDQGYHHARDRYLQMEMLRIVASGDICKYLLDDEESLSIDKFMKELGLKHYSLIEEKSLDAKTKKLLESYCAGVNSAAKKKRPFALIAKSVPYRDWHISDTIMTLKAMSYIGLASGQQDLEKILISLIQKGISNEKIESLINNQETLSEDIRNSLKDVKIFNKVIPSESELFKYIPKIQASNNWAVKIDSDIIHACDPHLECNRLPSIWYEMKINSKDKNFMGISMPGVPGIVMGRSDLFSFSFTYGFMDSIDYFVENIKEGKFRTESDFHPLKIRKETLFRKASDDIEMNIKETDCGTLECDNESEVLQDGKYLSMAWTCQKTGGAQTLRAITEIFDALSIEELSEKVSNVCISCNWILSDKKGNITYQQSGLAPLRKSTGLFPLAGHDKENRWKGLIDPKDLLHFKSTEKNYIVTANNDLTTSGFPKVINAPMASYRHDYIERLLKAGKSSISDFKEMHSSSYSIQAELFIKKYPKEFSQSPLKNFNCDYSIGSNQATIFESFYKKLLTNFLSDNIFNFPETNYLINQTCIIADFYGVFDRFFLEDLKEDEEKIWFLNKSKEKYIAQALDDLNEERSWGEVNKIDMNNIFFNGLLPAFLTRDKRNIPIKGNRATISQGAVYRSKNRATSFLPSWKMITQMSSNDIYSVLPGGLSDKIFSRYYQSDLNNWLTGKYRITKLKDDKK